MEVWVVEVEVVLSTLLLVPSVLVVLVKLPLATRVVPVLLDVTVVVTCVEVRDLELLELEVETLELVVLDVVIVALLVLVTEVLAVVEVGPVCNAWLFRQVDCGRTLRSNILEETWPSPEES